MHQVDEFLKLHFTPLKKPRQILARLFAASGYGPGYSFASLMAKLLAEGQARPKELLKREFTADDLTQTDALLKRFTRKRTGQHMSIVTGSTDRNRLIALLRRNGNLIKLLRQQLRPYKNSPTKHDVWLRFQGYTRVIERGGGGAPGGVAGKPAA